MPAGGVAAPEDDYHPKAGVYVANSSWGGIEQNETWFGLNLGIEVFGFPNPSLFRSEFAGYSASIVANKSIAWLREVAGKGKPFMLTVSRTTLPVAPMMSGIFACVADSVP